MKLLLDTHVLLWWLQDDPKLSATARVLISDAEHLAFISAATIWELRIKQGIGKLTLPPTFDVDLAREPFEHLAVTHAHAHALAHLPAHHRDPFDRMLIAQAQTEDLTLLTNDDVVRQYDVKSIMAS